MNLITRPATASDVAFIAHHLRPEDAAEVFAVSGRAPQESLPLSVPLADTYSFRLTPRDEPFALFGVIPDVNPEWGVVWFLATPALFRARAAVLREATYWLDAWALKYPGGLHNNVDSRNRLHLRWLALLGFEFDDEPVVIGGIPFIHAYRTKE